MSDDFYRSARALTTASGVHYQQVYLYPDGSADPSCVYARNDYAGTPVDVVVYCHGVGGDVDNFNQVRNKTTRDALIDDGGYVIVAANAAGKNFGNQAGLDAYLAIVNYAKRTYNVRYLHTYGQSMGGLTSALICLDSRFGGVRGHMGISPLCSLQHAAFEGFIGDIQAAYGFTGPFSETATAGHDPVGDYPASAWPVLTSVLLFASPDDTTVSMVNNAQVLVNKLKARLPLCSLTECIGGHLSSDHYRPEEMMAFYALASGDKPPDPPVDPPGNIAPGPDYWVDGAWCPSDRGVFINGDWQPVVHSVVEV